MANQAVLHKKLLSQLKDTCLTLGQPRILDYLKEHDGANQKEIAQGCHIEPATLTSVLNRMEEKKIIERRMLHGNCRSLYVFLTDLGKDLVLSVETAFSQIEEEAFQGVSEGEKEQFMKIFSRIYFNLTEKEGESLDGKM